MNTQEAKKLGELVGFAIGVDPKGVIALLKKHNIDISSQSSKKEIISAVFDQGLKKPAFQKDFKKLSDVLIKVVRQLPSKGSKSKAMSNFTEGDAIMDAQYSSADGFDWGGMTTGLVSAGASIFSTVKTTEAQEKLAKTQAQISANETAAAIALGQNQLEIEKLKLEQIKASSSTAPKNNTMLYVGFGVVGLLVVVGLVFALKKK